MTISFVGLGSNLDDPAARVRAAALALNQLPRTRLLRLSTLYVTPPWGTQDQPEFINAVAQIDTDLGARALLDELLAVEARAGRVRGGARWGPRLIDLDVLLFGEAVVDEPGLHIPHPHLAQRAFVLVPLVELSPEMQIPGLGCVQDLLARIDATSVRSLDSRLA